MMVQGVGGEMRRRHHHALKEAGIITMEGCPFATTKGVQGDALTEVYEEFDKPMVCLLMHSPELDIVFNTPQVGPAEAGIRL